MNERKEPWMDAPPSGGSVKSALGEPSWIKPGHGAALKGSPASRQPSASAEIHSQTAPGSGAEGEWRKAFRKARSANASFSALESKSSPRSIEAAAKSPAPLAASPLPSWARPKPKSSLLASLGTGIGSRPPSRARQLFEKTLPWLACGAGIALMFGYAWLARASLPTLAKLGSIVHVPKAAPWLVGAGICAVAVVALGLLCQWGASLWERRAARKAAMSKKIVAHNASHRPRRSKPKA